VAFSGAKIVLLPILNVFDGVFFGQIGVADFILYHDPRLTFWGVWGWGFQPFVDGLEESQNLENEIGNKSIEDNLEEYRPHALNVVDFPTSVNRRRDRGHKDGYKVILFLDS
jgi:hypothetical protein